MKVRSLVSLAAVLAFNAGAFAAPSDDADVALINPTPKAESFGARMAKARAKKSKTPKVPKAKKARAAKAPKMPKAPKIPTDGF